MRPRSRQGKRDERKPDPVTSGVVRPIYGCPSAKLGWPTRSAAKRAMKQARRHQTVKRVVSVYRCRFCPYWHTTSQEQR